MTLIEFARHQMQIAQGIVRDGGVLTPTLIFEDAGGKPGLGAVPDYGNQEAKQILREMMRRVMKEHGAVRYVFVMEAWTGSKTPEEMTPGYMPSNDPERREAIVISAAGADGEKIVLSSAITRDGGKVSFQEPEILNAMPSALLCLLEDENAETMH